MLSIATVLAATTGKLLAHMFSIVFQLMNEILTASAEEREGIQLFE